MTFRIFSQEKELKKAYDAATQSMQRISTLAANNGLKKEDVSTGVLTIAPIYEGDRKKRARSYYVPRHDSAAGARFLAYRPDSRRIG